MPKKLKPIAQSEEDRLADAVRTSAQRIWKAGLGAFVKAQQEGGRSFTRLVRDGTELQRRARQVEDASDTVARAAERASRRASGSWGKLEQVFEERVARALGTIGVPARSEVEALERRIDELEKLVVQLADQRVRAAAGLKPAARRAAKPAVTAEAAAPAPKRAAKAPAKSPAKPAAAKRATKKSAAK
jgi:poly(hydroxyalkanoate) granule-associated protein